MNKRQIRILTRIILVVVLTGASVVGLLYFRVRINKSEAIKGMEIIGAEIVKYRQNEGRLPHESFVEKVKAEMRIVRVGKIRYRRVWINPDSTPDTILAYCEQNFHSFLYDPGYVALRLDGRVEWMDKEAFESHLRSQQSQMEIELTGTD